MILFLCKYYSHSLNKEFTIGSHIQIQNVKQSSFIYILDFHFNLLSFVDGGNCVKITLITARFYHKNCSMSRQGQSCGSLFEP